MMFVFVFSVEAAPGVTVWSVLVAVNCVVGSNGDGEQHFAE